MPDIRFDAPDLARAVERLTEAEKNALPFGAIHLDRNDVVTFYNTTEARQSGFENRPSIGTHFFGSVAPCMDIPDMRGRIDAARENGTVDIEIGWVGDFRDPDGEFLIRALSASDGGLWLFFNRDAA